MVRSDETYLLCDEPSLQPTDVVDDDHEDVAVAPSALSFDDEVRRLTPRSTQRANLNNTLAILKKHGYRRLLIIIEHNTAFHTDDNEGVVEDMGRHYSLVCVDTLLRARGDGFRDAMRTFNDPHASPMALLSFGDQDRILVGADLKFVDAIVCVGAIENRLLTQAVGRVFRPLAAARTRPLRVVKIFVGRSSHRRRQRVFDSDDEVLD